MPSEQYRSVEVVSPNLRNQILSGKDINLALLLMSVSDLAWPSDPETTIKFLPVYADGYWTSNWQFSRKF